MDKAQWNKTSLLEPTHPRPRDGAALIRPCPLRPQRDQTPLQEPRETQALHTWLLLVLLTPNQASHVLHAGVSTLRASSRCSPGLRRVVACIAYLASQMQGAGAHPWPTLLAAHTGQPLAAGNGMLRVNLSVWWEDQGLLTLGGWDGCGELTPTFASSDGKNGSHCDRDSTEVLQCVCSSQAL